MGESVRKCVPSTLLLLIVTISVGNALKAANPHKNHDGVLENGKEEDITHWHGLDYDFGMFDHSNEVGKTKNETQKVDNSSSILNKTGFASYDEYSDEHGWGWEDDDSYEDDDYSLEEQQDHDKITITYKKVASSVPTAVPAKKVEAPTPEVAAVVPPSKMSPEDSSPPLPKKGKDDKTEDADYWKEDEGDSDDGEGEEDKQKEKEVNNLPSDNDIDSDKYFNPDRFQSQLDLHQIEDHLLSIWTVQYPESHLPCIMLRGDIRLIVPVNPTWFNREFVEIDVPGDAEASGTCSTLNNDYQEIRLNWNVSIPEKNKVYNNSVYFGFATNWTSEFSDLKIPQDKYALVSITVVYYNGEIGNGDEGVVSFSVSDLVEYMTPLNQSMSCSKENQQLIVGNMQLMLSNMQLEAFRPNVETLTMGEFSRSVLCASDEVYVFDAVMTYVIWFWIGALLMVLLIFAVLLGLGYRRRRCQNGQGGFGYKILSA